MTMHGTLEYSAVWRSGRDQTAPKQERGGRIDHPGLREAGRRVCVLF